LLQRFVQHKLNFFSSLINTAEGQAFGLGEIFLFLSPL
jgi:hypothetical protein